MTGTDLRGEVLELCLDPDGRVPPDGSLFQPLTFFAERPDQAENGPHLPLAIICWQCWDRGRGRTQVLELAMLRCTLALYCGRLLSVDEALVLLHDPGRPLPPALMRDTGLTSEALAGHTLRPGDVTTFLDGVGCALAVSQGSQLHALQQAVPSACALTWLSGELVTWAESGNLFSGADPCPVSRRALRRCLKAARELSQRNQAVRTYFREHGPELLSAAQAAAVRSTAVFAPAQMQEQTGVGAPAAAQVPPPMADAPRYSAPRLLDGCTPQPYAALRPGLRVWRAGTPAALLERCAAIMRSRPPPDALTPEWLVAERSDLAGCLEQGLAVRHALAAHCRTTDLTGLAWMICCRLHDLPPALSSRRSLFARPRLDLALAALLGEAQCPLPPSVLQGTDGAGERMVLAVELSAVFERYQLLRPQWITWADGLTPEDLICAESGAEPPGLRAVLEQQLEAARGTGAIVPDQLRQTLSWQLCLWRRLHLRAAQALCREQPQASQTQAELLGMDRVQLFERVHAELQRPWLTPQLSYARLPQRTFIFGLTDLNAPQGHFLHALSRHCAVHVMLLCPGAAVNGGRQPEGHALRSPLWQWCGHTRRTLRALHPQAEQLQDEEHEPQGSSTLAQLQRHLLHPPDPGFTHTALRAGDTSLQIRRCRSALGELQAVRAALLERLREDRAAGHDPSLSEVTVMAPDIGRYAPLIPAVFTADGSPCAGPLAYTICDRSRLQACPLAEAVLQLLTRCGRQEPLTLGQVLQLLDCRSLCRRFALDDGDLDGVRHGARTGATCGDELQRLLCDSLRCADGPEGSAGGMAQTLGRLQALAQALEALRSRLQEGDRSLAQWADLLEQVLDGFFAACDPHGSGQLAALHDLIRHLGTDAPAAPLDGRCSASELCTLLRTLWAEQHAPVQLPGRGITFCSLTAGRALPCRHLFLIGMEQGRWPRPVSGTACDLTRTPALSPGSAGDGDGELFARTLLTAGVSLHITYAGAAAPAPAVEALLDLLDECCDCGCAAAGRARRTRKRFAGDEEAVPEQAAGSRADARELPATLCASLAQVSAFCHSPCRAYLAARQRGGGAADGGAAYAPAGGRHAACGTITRTCGTPLRAVLQIRAPGAATAAARRVRISLSAAQDLGRGAGEELLIPCPQHGTWPDDGTGGPDPAPGSVLEAALRSCCAVLSGNELAARQMRYDVLLSDAGGRQLRLRGFTAGSARRTLRRLLAFYALAQVRPLPVCAQFLRSGAISDDFGQDEECRRLFGGQAPGTDVQRALFEDFRQLYQELRTHMLPSRPAAPAACGVRPAASAGREG